VVKAGAALGGVLTQDDSGRVSTPLEPIVLAATLAMIPVLILEADATGGWHAIAIAANWLIWAIFAVEYVLILVAAPRKQAALRAHWLDPVVVVVTTPLFGKFLASLRLVRLARLLRLLRASAIIARAIRAERALTSGTTLRLVALITLFIVVVAGAAQSAFDAGEFPSVWDGVWWAVVTVTTVGYGDIAPANVGGRLIGMAVMLVGIGFLSVLTATVASHFVKTERSDETSEILASLDEIKRELGELRARIEGVSPYPVTRASASSLGTGRHAKADMSGRAILSPSRRRSTVAAGPAA
jgi:voltage-gated potassium channel